MLTRRSFAACAALTPIAAACQSPAAPTVASWSVGQNAPYAVQEIYPALYRDAIWVAGGFSPQARGATERVIAYDIARDAWIEGPALPAPAHHVHLAVLGDTLWAIGGFLGGENRVSWICTQRVLKLSGGEWVQGPPLPTPIGEAAPIVHDNRIHLIGGRAPHGTANAAWNDHRDVDSHFAIGAGDAAWSQLAPLPMARNSTAGVSDGARIHVISGRTVAAGQTPRHDIFDPRSGAWRQGHAFPEPRGGLAGAYWRGDIIAGGGEVFEPGSVGSQLYRYDAAAGWRAGPTMPTPRHGHGLIAAGDRLFALGGARRPSAEQPLDSIEALG